MIKILVVDDHAVVRRGVLQILNESPDYFAVEEAKTGQEVLQAVRANQYDMVLLDIALPDINGLEVLNQLQGMKPELPVLILSMYPEKQYATRALKVGAAGYVTKESVPNELVTAVHRVSQGGKYVSLALAEELLAELGGEVQPEAHQTLSDREYQVMLMLASGKTVTKIAAELVLSVKTVSTYRGRILGKLGLSNTAEIIRYAFQHRLVE